MAGVSSRLQTTVASRLQTVQAAQNMLMASNTTNNLIATTTPVPIVKIQSPFQGDDVQRRILNVDSRFRSDPDNSTTSNFSFTLTKPIKNAVRVRVV